MDPPRRSEDRRRKWCGDAALWCTSACKRQPPHLAIGALYQTSWEGAPDARRTGREPAQCTIGRGNGARQAATHGSIGRYTTLVPSGPSVRICGPSAVIGDGVLEVRGHRPVGGEDRPAVGVEADVVGAGGDHRLDREHHALLQLRAAAGRAVVRDLRVLVHAPPDAVADELADDAEALRLDVRLARRGRCRAGGCRPSHCSIAAKQRLRWQTASSRSVSAVDLADRHRDGRVADEAAVGDADVDRQDVAVGSTYGPGMPCTIMSFGDEQIEPGKPR